jgi:carboxyl-terminal processing protease
VTRCLAACLLGVLLGCTPQRGTIGAVLGQDRDGHLFVREVPEDLAAAKADLRPGDEILLIDGKDARAMSAKGVHEALSGEVGEPVRLTLVRDGQIVRVTLKRTAARRYRTEGGAVEGGTAEGGTAEGGSAESPPR